MPLLNHLNENTDLTVASQTFIQVSYEKDREPGEFDICDIKNVICK